jgi:hypothetical protein
MNKKLILPPVNRAAYSDRTAWILANCSKFAYDTGTRLAKALKPFHLKLDNEYADPKTQNSAYLAVHEAYAVLAFKGTVPSESGTVKTDLDFKMVRARYGEFHQGFLDAYRKFSKEIEVDLAKLEVPIYVTGHSLGGALALVATTFLKEQDKLAACYTYGCPKVGNDRFAHHLFKVPVYRCVHHADIVPAVPFTIMGYRQYGDIRFLTGNDKVCGGSAAVFSRFLAMLNPINIIHWISDHAIENYVHILEEFAESRN